MPLEQLNCSNTQAFDPAPLNDMPLSSLAVDPTLARDAEILLESAFNKRTADR